MGEVIDSNTQSDGDLGKTSRREILTIAGSTLVALALPAHAANAKDTAPR